MNRAGIIMAVIAFVIALGLTLISPICPSCAVIFLGLGAGYLAGVFDEPSDNGASTKAGAIAGGIGSVGALLGLFAGSGLNAMLMGPEKTAALVEQFGVQIGDSAAYASSYWMFLVGYAVCFGILNIALMAALGALGGVLWWQITGKNKNTSVTV